MMTVNGEAMRKDKDDWHCFTLYKASARHPELRNIFLKKGVCFDNIYAMPAMLVKMVEGNGIFVHLIGASTA